MNLKLTSAISIALRVLLLGGKFFLTLALARLTTPETVGLYALIVTVITILLYAIGAELHTYTTREFAVREDDVERSRHFQNHTQFVLAGFVVCLPIAWIVLKSLNISEKFPFGLFALVLIGETLSQELGRYLLSLSRAVASNFLQVLRGAAWIPFAIWALYAERWPAINVVLTAWGAGSMLAVLFGIWHLRHLVRTKHSFTLGWLSQAVSSARHYFAVVLLTQAQTYADRFVIQHYLGISQVGLFSFYQSFANIVQGFVQTGIISILLPRLILAIGRNDSTGARHISTTMLKKSLLLAIAISVAMSLVMPSVLTLVHHEEYGTVYGIFPWLLLGNVLLIAGQVPHLVLYASRKDALLLRIALFTVPAGIAANIIFVPFFGLAGAVGVFVASAAIQAIVKTWFVHSSSMSHPL